MFYFIQNETLSTFLLDFCSLYVYNIYTLTKQNSMNIKNRKYILNLAFTLVASLLPFACTTMTIGEVWDGISREVIVPIGSLYEIRTPAQLAWLAEKGSYTNTESYTLHSDINLGKHIWTPIGDDSTVFRGSFDGGNHIIRGLNLELPNGQENTGLFGFVSGVNTTDKAEIKNLKIQINDNFITETFSPYAGVLMGSSKDTKINNISIIGDLTINSNHLSAQCNVGGIVGRAEEGTEITYSSVSINMDATAKHNINVEIGRASCRERV